MGNPKSEWKAPRQLPTAGVPFKGRPSPTKQKHWMTFAKGRAPSPTKESPDSDARIDEAHWLPLPTWQTERAPHNEANCLRSGEGKGEEDLECPLPLEPHLQELLGGEESSPASAEVGDGLPPPMSMPKDPEPSPLCQSDWIQWSAQHVETPTWWKELLKILGHDNC